MEDDLYEPTRTAIHRPNLYFNSGRLKSKPIPKHTIEDSGVANWDFQHDTPKGNYLFSNETDNLDFAWSFKDKWVKVYDDRDRSQLAFDKKWNKVALADPNKIEYRDIADNGYTTRERRILVPGIDSNIVKRKIEFSTDSIRYQYYENGDINLCRKSGFGFIAMFIKPKVFNQDNEQGQVDQTIVNENGALYHQVVIDQVWFDAQTEVVLDPDFTITSTADFDAGTKSEDTNNYQVETYTDNQLIGEDQLGMGDLRGDEFNNSDPDALTGKWEDSALWGRVGTYSADIDTTVNDALHMLLTQTGGVDAKCGNQLTQSVTGDFDIRVNLDLTDLPHADSSFWYLTFYKDIDNRFYINRSRNTLLTVKNRIQSNHAGGVATDFATTDNEISLRIRRVGTDYYTYYDLAGGDSWTQQKTGTITGDDGKIIIAGLATTDAHTTEGSFSNFKGNTIAFAAGGVHTSGNWESAAQTMTAGKKLKNTTINVGSMDGNNYLDKVEWLVGGVVKATYDTNISANTTISSPTSGSFDDVNTNFTIKVYLVGDGSTIPGPQIGHIEGEYESARGGKKMMKGMMINKFTNGMMIE